jgi:hypothetical protein
VIATARAILQTYSGRRSGSPAVIALKRMPRVIGSVMTSTEMIACT